MGKTAKRSKSRINESAELAQALMNCPGLGFYIVQHGRFIYVNELFQELTGYTEEELRSIHPLDLVHPEDRELVRERAIENLKGHSVLPYEYRFIKKNGEIMWNLERLASIEYGGKRAAVGSFMDVTNSKRTEEVLADEVTRRRMLMERSRDGISILDEDSKLLEANQRFAEMLGYTPEELKGLHTWDWDTQWTREELLEMGHKVDEAGAHLETLHRRKDGTLLDVELSVNSAVVAGKKLIFCVSRDITERKRAEQALAEEAMRRRMLMENSIVGISVLDENCKLVDANKRFLDMLGYSTEEARGLHVWNWDDHYTPEEIREMVRTVDETGQHFETRHRRKDGTYFDVELSNSAVVVGGKKLVLCVSSDVTERKRAEEAIRRSEQNFRDSIENSPLGIRILDRDGKTLYANRALLDTWGYSSVEELEAVPRKQRYTPQTYAEHLERLEQRKRGEPAPLSYEASIVRSDGQIRILSVSRGELLWGGEECFQIVSQDITEYKQLEGALAKSEERYRTVLDQMEEAYYEVDIAGKFTFCNDAMCRQLGYSREELMGMSFKVITPPDDVKRVFGFYNQAYRTGEPFTSVPIERVRKDGSRISVESSIFPLRDNSGKIIGFRGLAADVTERRQAEEALHRSEQNFRDSIENSPLGIRILDKDGKALYANRALLDMWGYSSLEEMEAVPKEKLYTPQAYAEHRGRFGKRKQGERGHIGYETSIVRSDGQVRHVSASRGDLLWGGEECFQVVYRDITEQKQLQEALAKSEERYRTVLDQMEEAYYETDIAGNYTFVNDALCRQSGYSKEELIGMNYKVYTPEEEAPRVYKAFNRVYETGKAIRGVPTARIRKDGTRISTETSAFPLRNESGQIIGFRGVTRDVTERRQMIEALSQSEERYRTILVEIQEGYYETDLAGNFTFVNDAICSQLGYPMEELIGMNYKNYVPKEEIKGIYKAWNKVYRTGKPLQSYPFTGVRKDKKQIFLEASISPLRNKEGKIIGFRSISRDVTERAQFERKLAEMATHDALTGLPNRTLLSDRFTVALALSRRSRSKLAVLMLDLDRFKAVNDSMGHDVGDKLLKAVGKRLKATVRKSDTVARIGGDEFVLLLPQIPHEEEAAKFSQRILDVFRESFVVEGNRIRITTSIGIAIYPEGGKDIESLLKSADTAMYWAKEQGRDIYRLYDGSEAATLLARRRVL
jgi:diguanylate cyclase (GGDEF)-like protein/PAS domain S-box-containing protein